MGSRPLRETIEIVNEKINTRYERNHVKIKHGFLQEHHDERENIIVMCITMLSPRMICIQFARLTPLPMQERCLMELVQFDNLSQTNKLWRTYGINYRIFAFVHETT